MRRIASFATTRWGQALLAVVLIALVAGLVFQGVGREPASAAPAQVDTLAEVMCTPLNVASFTSRVHVKCSEAFETTVHYFAYPTSDSAGASRMLSIFSTAYALSQRVIIWYTPGDTSGNAWGCNAGDCRTIWGAGVAP